MSWYFNNRDRITEEIADGIIDGFGIRKMDTDYTNWIGTVK